MADYNTLVYTEQGGARQVIASGGSLDVESGGELDIESGGALKLAGTQVTATAAEINAAADASGRIVAGGTAATIAVTAATHGERIVVLTKADGITATLPAATGSGVKYHFIVGAAVTSVGTVIQVTGDDTMTGNALFATDAGDGAEMFEAGATADTITMNGSTTGGLKGDSVELIDIAADLWWVRMVAAGTGEEATPFSAAVS
jgi:hypothetical protein